MSTTTNEMSMAEIIEAFSLRGPIRDNAVVAALAQRDAIIPELIRILEQIVATPARFDGSPLLIYALFLLSHFKATAAHQLFVGLLRSKDWFNVIFDELITEKFDTFLYRTYDNNPEPCKALVADTEADEFARVAGVDLLVHAVAKERLDREEVLTFLSEVLATEPRGNEDAILWSLVMHRLNQLYPAAHMDLIRALYAADLVDPRVIALPQIERTVAEGSVAGAIAEARQEAEAFDADDSYDDLYNDLEEWLESYNDEPPMESMRSSIAGHHPSQRIKTTPKQKKNKNKRKITKASRKKNRRK